jgi:hypothetical protein
MKHILFKKKKKITATQFTLIMYDAGEVSNEHLYTEHDMFIIYSI